MRKTKKFTAAVFLVAGMGLGPIASPVQAVPLGFADVVLDFFNSGANAAFPAPASYGGEFVGGIGFPVAVPTSVVLGDDPNAGLVDFLSLPTGSFVIVGFLDEIIIDSAGDDIFIQEIGGSGERADVFVSSVLSTNMADFTFIGVAVDNATTSFDLSSIAFTDPVRAIKIVGLDNGGGSPGFDVVNVRGLPGSFVSVVPEPHSLGLLALGLLGVGFARKRRTH